MLLRAVVSGLLVGSLVATSAAAVGLGPLSRSGVTDGAGKAFYLTLTNPYTHAESFEALPLANDAEESAPRVVVFPAVIRLRGKARASCW